jgi:hypothetical protein
MPVYPLVVDVPESDIGYEIISFSVAPIDSPPTLEDLLPWVLDLDRVIVGIYVFADVSGSPPVFSGSFDASYAFELSTDFTAVSRVLFDRDSTSTYNVVIMTARK